MLLRLAVAAGVVALVLAALALWRLPPRKLRRVDLRQLGVPGPAIVQFSTRYCAPCKAAEPQLREVAARSDVPYVHVDVGQRPEVARRHAIRTVPTIAVAGRDGRVHGVWTALPRNGAIAEAARRARG